MEKEVADRNNREGMMGWLNPRRYGWERVSYWLQRLTGVGLLAYFIAHIYETSQIAGGPALWEAFLELTQTTLGHIILIVVIGMCVYPYDAVSLNYRQKSGIWIALILALVAMLYGASVLFGGE
jgi:succinate dehydrogenase / fumarate reductase cytochrome b subunit